MRRDPLAEVVAVERFRRRQREERVQQQARDRRLVGAPGRGGAPFLVARRAIARAHEIVDQRVGRAGVAGDRIRSINEGDIRDAAEIEHRDRLRPRRASPQAPGDRPEPAARPARRPRRPRRGNRRPPECLTLARERRAVAELDRQAFLRPVQDGLAMKSDHVDARAGRSALASRNMSTAAACSVVTTARPARSRRGARRAHATRAPPPSPGAARLLHIHCRNGSRSVRSA